MFNFVGNWQILWCSATARRRSAAMKLGNWSEGLETRCLLSASKGHRALGIAAEVALESKQAVASEAHDMRKQTFPSFAGTWDIVTHAGGDDIHGILVLQQHGKKITGTLTNDMQPPGKFKAKLMIAHDGSVEFAGTCQNRVVSSKPCDVTGDAQDLEPGGSNGLDYIEGRFAPRDQNGEPADFSGHTVFDN